MTHHHHQKQHAETETVKRLFTEHEAAEYLGVSRSYLRQDRMNGQVGIEHLARIIVASAP